MADTKTLTYYFIFQVVSPYKCQRGLREMVQYVQGKLL